MRRRDTANTDRRVGLVVSFEAWRYLRLLATEQDRSVNDILNAWIEEKLSANGSEAPR